MSYFPESKRNFKLENIYKGSRDGWHDEIYLEKVRDKGPTLIILKTTDGAICGGYTSKNWCNYHEGMYCEDIDAFVFNMTRKYIASDSKMAIHGWAHGFVFGDFVLHVSGTLEKPLLNSHNLGYSAKGNGYDELEEKLITTENSWFTVAQLEVYKVIYY